MTNRPYAQKPDNNKPVFPKVDTLTIEEWLTEGCKEGDTLKIHKNDHFIGLENKRTNQIFMLENKQPIKYHQIELPEGCTIDGFYKAVEEELKRPRF